MLGPPGVGKGTQAELISQRFGACQLSTGDVLRASRERPRCDCSPALARALAYLDAGALVPDETVLAIVGERAQCLRCGGGFLLDGFPRTVAQAEALAEILKVNSIELEAVLSYALPPENIVARLSGRRTCFQCGKIYHLESRPPRSTGICDACGKKLVQRDDDRPEAIRVCQEEYQRSTAPLVEYYRRAGLLITIEAEATPEVIFDRTLAALKAKRRSYKAARPRT